MKLKLNTILFTILIGLIANISFAQAGSECTACGVLDALGYNNYTVSNGSNITSISYDTGYNLAGDFQDEISIVDGFKNAGAQLTGYFTDSSESKFIVIPQISGFASLSDVVNAGNRTISSERYSTNVELASNIFNSLQNEGEQLAAASLSATQAANLCTSCNVFGPQLQGSSSPTGKIVDIKLEELPSFVLSDHLLTNSERFKSKDENLYSSGSADGLLETTSSLLALTNGDVREFGELHGKENCKSCSIKGKGEDGSRIISAFEDFGEKTLETYLDYEDIIGASISTLGGVITTTAGITLASVPGAQGLAIVAITYGTAQTGFGLVKLNDAIKRKINSNTPVDPRLERANNIGQLAGNDLEEKGIPYAGEVGFYIGETIEFSSNLSAGITKLNRSKNLIQTGAAVFKITTSAQKAIETSISAAYDLFLSKANNNLANVTDLKSKINFYEVATGIQIEVIFEAKNEEGEFIQETKQFIIKANNIIENHGQ